MSNLKNLKEAFDKCRSAQGGSVARALLRDATGHVAIEDVPARTIPMAIAALTDEKPARLGEASTRGTPKNMTELLARRETIYKRYNSSKRPSE